jgi:RNA 2',3'-cyclic 3'-phosphodiesterase
MGGLAAGPPTPPGARRAPGNPGRSSNTQGHRAIATVRTFVAVLLPDEIRGRLAQEIDGLRRHASGVAWVAVENLHITVKFLGGVEETRLAEVSAALERAATVPAFGVDVRGLGAFPSTTRPRVLWAGAPGAPEFTRLAEDVDRALVSLGFAPESRGFTPHVTLGRVREPRRNVALSEALEDAVGHPFGALRVERLSLMRSDLSPRGARYTELSAVPLPAP